MNYLHRAWAEIDLDALLHNFRIIKNSTTAKIFSVVKANAYGHSVYMIAKLLDSEGTDYFAVSNIDEAKELEIETMVPAELERLKSEWEKQNETKAQAGRESLQKSSTTTA